MIPVANPLAQTKRFEAEIFAAIERVVASGQYILGPEVEHLEAEFAAFTGTGYAVGVANATDALAIALRALDIGPGDEVITVSMTAVATVAAIRMVGATPVLVDIEPDYYTIAPSAINAAISNRTRAVIPVHLYGQPADLESIVDLCSRRGIPVIEDASQAHGAMISGKRVGGIGLIGVFSCYPTKNLGAIGDAGLITTNDPLLAQRLKRLRQYGWESRNWSTESGVNSRLDEIQAAILRVKLRSLVRDNAIRVQIAARYLREFSDLPISLPKVRSSVYHVWHLFVVRVSDRENLQRQLLRLGVSTAIHYPFPVHIQDAYRSHVVVPDLLKVTELYATSVLSIPMYPELSEEDVGTVITAIGRSLASYTD